MHSLYVLVIGNKNYSSWSMRPWVWMRHHGLNFEEQRIGLYTDETSREIGAFGCGTTVPILLDGTTRIWDSLSILEYLAEKHPATQGWPQDPAARAHARSVSAEMHSGFVNIRSELPMNCRRVINNFNVPEQVKSEVQRIDEIFTDCRRQYADTGDWLFGQYTIADAMFAPIVMRFNTYKIELQSEAKTYLNTVTKQAAVAEWIADSIKETEIIENAEK